MKTLSRVNDFVVKFANVNGSGSASANGLFAMSELPLLLADASIDAAVEKFYTFLKVVLNLVALVLVLWSGLKFSDGHVREGVMALIGAFVVLIARIIVNQLAGT
jgi:hypothetical protein